MRPVHGQIMLRDSLSFSLLYEWLSPCPVFVYYKFYFFSAITIYLSIRISATFILLTCSFVVAQTLGSYNSTGLRIVLYFSFNLTDVHWLHKTRHAFLHFIQFDFILWLISSTISPSWLLIDAKYLHCCLCGISWSSNLTFSPLTPLLQLKLLIIYYVLYPFILNLLSSKSALNFSSL